MSIEHILFVVSQEAKAARGNRSNQSVGEVTMNIALRKNEVKGSSVLKKIKVESKVDEGRDVIVSRATVKWEVFQSFMVLWTKLYGRV